MAGYFLDSSALAKRYVQEGGTAWIRELTHRGTAHQIYLPRITAVEVTAAVMRRRKGGSIPPRRASSILSRFRKHLAGRYTVLEVTPAILAGAMKLANSHSLRAYDAVQLNAAALGEGLAVEDPAAYP
jgi:predicted nucleic acid-binding protein